MIQDISNFTYTLCSRKRLSALTLPKYKPQIALIALKNNSLVPPCILKDYISSSTFRSSGGLSGVWSSYLVVVQSSRLFSLNQTATVFHLLYFVLAWRGLYQPFYALSQGFGLASTPQSSETLWHPRKRPITAPLRTRLGRPQAMLSNLRTPTILAHRLPMITQSGSSAKRGEMSSRMPCLIMIPIRNRQGFGTLKTWGILWRSSIRTRILVVLEAMEDQMKCDFLLIKIRT